MDRIKDLCNDFNISTTHFGPRVDPPGMKTCSGCKATKSLTEFGINRATKDGRQRYCTLCQRAKVKAHYDSNVDYYVEKAKRHSRAYHEAVRTWLTEYLLAHPCVDCDETDLRCLQFDHVGENDKVTEVSEMVRRGYRLATIQAEVAKCAVRCANCHMKRTALQFNWWSHQFMEASSQAS